MYCWTHSCFNTHGITSLDYHCGFAFGSIGLTFLSAGQPAVSFSLDHRSLNNLISLHFDRLLHELRIVRDFVHSLCHPILICPKNVVSAFVWICVCVCVCDQWSYWLFAINADVCLKSIFCHFSINRFPFFDILISFFHHFDQTFHYF